MKKYFVETAIVLMAACVAAGIIWFNPDAAKRAPGEGIYWICQNSFYAVAEGESIYLGLDCFCVEKAADLENISDIVFLDESGEKVEVLNRDYVIEKIGDMGKLPNGLSWMQYLVNAEITVPGAMTLTGIEYCLGGQVYNRPIGRIEIVCVEPTGQVVANQNRISWVSSVQPTFYQVEYILKNATQDDVVVTDVAYGGSKIAFVQWENITIHAGQELETDLKVSLEEEAGVPIVYYLKPILEYKIDGVFGRTPFENISKEAYCGEREGLIEYLYQQSIQYD